MDAANLPMPINADYNYGDGGDGDSAFPYSSLQEFEDPGGAAGNEGEKGCNLTWTLETLYENCTLNSTTDGEAEVQREFAVRVVIGVLLTIIILATIIGKSKNMQ